MRGAFERMGTESPPLAGGVGEGRISTVIGPADCPQHALSAADEPLPEPLPQGEGTRIRSEMLRRVHNVRSSRLDTYLQRHQLAVLSLPAAAVLVAIIVLSTLRHRRGSSPSSALPASPTLDPAKSPPAAHDSMIWIPSGSFRMGSDFPAFSDARPIHSVDLDGFWIDKALVTNAFYDMFVKATGYITVAEQKPNPADFPGVAPEKLVPGSLVYNPPPHSVSLDDVSKWWA